MQVYSGNALGCHQRACLLVQIEDNVVRFHTAQEGRGDGKQQLGAVELLETACDVGERSDVVAD
jgi:hypothetical protein